MKIQSKNRLFKKLTRKNWRKRDTTADPFVRIEEGVSTKISDDDWAAAFLELELSSDVPEEVQNLFEVAQGTLCYGCYFYPLYTLGSEQFYRVLEAALRHKCLALGAPNSVATFAKMLNWLEHKGFMTEPRLGQWNAARQLRNSASHADRQSLYDPILALSGIRLAAEHINELFQPTNDST